MSKVDMLLENAVRLSDRPEDTFPKLARALAKLYAHDKNLLRQFLGASTMGRRKAYYLIELGKRIQGLKLPEKRLKRIGWTKMQVLAKHLTLANADDLLARAEANSAQKLAAMLRGEQCRERARCVLLYFSPRQYREFERAVLSHGGSRSGRGLVAKEEALIKAIREADRQKNQLGSRVNFASTPGSPQRTRSRSRTMTNGGRP
jgi:hypothetical protein